MRICFKPLHLLAVSLGGGKVCLKTCVSVLDGGKS